MLATFTGREPHPVIPLLDERRINLAKHAAEVEAYYKSRAKLLFSADYDPLRFGFEPPHWKEADKLAAQLKERYPDGVTHLLVLGGNRSGKTTRAAKRVIQCAIQNPGCRIWCLQSTEVASRADQQALIYRFLPPEWRPVSGRMKPKGDRTTKIVYSDAGGFTNNILVLPNGSKIEFKFYGADVKTLESAELIMVWADELIQPDWIEALRFRLVNRNGHMLITFTPVEGYSSTVKMYLQNAVTIEEVEAPLLPKYDNAGKVAYFQKVPRIQQSGIPMAMIIYFHTSDNPFGNYKGMEAEVRGSNEERIKTRVYGVPTKSSSSQFNFNSAVHVITQAEFAEWVRKYPNGTRYHLVDPCSGRNWFMGWAFCPTADKVIWYREWPTFGHGGAYIEGIGDPGPWATLVSTKIRREGTKAPEDGERGPAQDPFKFSLRRYQQEILKAEAGEAIFERRMDSRFGNSPKEEAEGVTTLIEQMEDLGMTFDPMTSEKKILGVNDGSIDMINSALYYDKTKDIGEFSAELARINEPLMQVVETCPNMINSLETWTGRDGGTGACKDPIDVIRGFFLSELRGFSANDFTPYGGGCY